MDPNLADSLEIICAQLRAEAQVNVFTSAAQFEARVREIAAQHFGGGVVDLNPPAQAFPDVELKGFRSGIEVKFTTGDTWRCVANSVLETNRIYGVDSVYLVYGKMGGSPDVRWGLYDDCVVHVRTSHVPRFEVDLDAPQERSLFKQMGTSYEKFRVAEMHEKMQYIRSYARGRLRDGERLWWLEDSPNDPHSLPLQVRLYTKLTDQEKARLRAEAVLLCPQIVGSGRRRGKYDDFVLYLMTYHGVLCHQARDLFSAGSVANPSNDDEGGLYIERSLKLLEPEIAAAAFRMDGALFEEYWGNDVPHKERIAEWLRRADEFATEWVPSESLFKAGS